MVIHFAIVPFTGSSVNPARSIASAVIGQKDLGQLWIYIVGPVLGGAIGWADLSVRERGGGRCLTTVATAGRPRVLGAPELLRSVGLLADGPATWGTPVRSNRPGVFLVELPAPLASAPIDMNVVGRWIERRPRPDPRRGPADREGAGRPAQRASGCPTRPSSTSGCRAPRSAPRGGRVRPDPARRPAAARRWLLAQDPDRPRALPGLVGRDGRGRGVRGRPARGLRRDGPGGGRRGAPRPRRRPARSPTSRPPTASASTTGSRAACWPDEEGRPGDRGRAPGRGREDGSRRTERDPPLADGRCARASLAARRDGRRHAGDDAARPRRACGRQRIGQGAAPADPPVRSRGGRAAGRARAS